MSEMVEKVARAIWAERVRACAENGVGLEAWGEGAFFVADAGEQSVSLMNNILGEARAAIEAMREPTETMKYAGGTKLENMMFGGDPEGSDVIFADVGIVFRDMIDASLHEGEAER